MCSFVLHHVRNLSILSMFTHSHCIGLFAVMDGKQKTRKKDEFALKKKKEINITVVQNMMRMVGRRIIEIRHLAKVQSMDK
jgi:hypothetical protein